MDKELLPVTLKPDEHGVYIYGVMPDGSENMVMDLSFEIRIRGWGGLTGNGGGRGLDHKTAAGIQKMWQQEICNRYNSQVPRSEYDKAMEMLANQAKTIMTLKQQADRLSDSVSFLLPMAKAHAFHNDVGSNVQICKEATAELAEYRKETE